HGPEREHTAANRGRRTSLRLAYEQQLVLTLQELDGRPAPPRRPLPEVHGRDIAQVPDLPPCPPHAQAEGEILVVHEEVLRQAAQTQRGFPPHHHERTANRLDVARARVIPVAHQVMTEHGVTREEHVQVQRLHH